MTLPRALFLVSILLFSTIVVASFFKGKRAQRVEDFTQSIEIEVKPVAVVDQESPTQAEVTIAQEPTHSLSDGTPLEMGRSMEGIPQADRIKEFFSVRGAKFPIVETITYKSKADWLPGRSAWLSDYASHYKTSRHFIARSLNGRPDYFKQDTKEGDRFNVLRSDKEMEFYLLIDLSRSKLWFYYIDINSNERVLVKTYDVSLGRPDPSSLSGSLTPVGKYALGDRVGIYKPKKMGVYYGQKTEMIRIFGTRWLPLGEELADCSDGAKGLGIHGLPWLPDATGEFKEDLSMLGKYESDGCVRLATKDIEELFAIIITKPTTVELVKDFQLATLPGTEKSTAVAAAA